MTSHSKQEPADTDIDVLRPGPTKNALARARQMLDDLEMEDESLERFETSLIVFLVEGGGGGRAVEGSKEVCC